MRQRKAVPSTTMSMKHGVKAPSWFVMDSHVPLKSGRQKESMKGSSEGEGPGADAGQTPMAAAAVWSDVSDGSGDDASGDSVPKKAFRPCERPPARWEVVALGRLPSVTGFGKSEGRNGGRTMAAAQRATRSNSQIPWSCGAPK